MEESKRLSAFSAVNSAREARLSVKQHQKWFDSTIADQMTETERKIACRRMLHNSAEQAYRWGYSATTWQEDTERDMSDEVAIVGEKEMDAIVAIVWLHRGKRKR